MSAAAATSAAAAPRVALGRLTLVELRKAVDTRAGFWLLLTIALLTVLVLVLLAATADSFDAQDAVSLSMAPTSLLLPIVGILLVTSEFSQRTALTTFALVPSRLRVMAAKLLAAVVLAAGAAAICLVGAAVATGIGGGDGSLTSSMAAEAVAYGLLNVAMGFGFGVLLLSSPLAIVLSFVVPIAWGILVEAVHGLHGVRDWLDTGTTWQALIDQGGAHWGRVLVSAAVWIGLPVAIGLARLHRAEVK